MSLFVECNTYLDASGELYYYYDYDCDHVVNDNIKDEDEYSIEDNDIIIKNDPLKNNMKHTYENTFCNNKYFSKIIKKKIFKQRKDNIKIKNKRMTKEINKIVSKHYANVIV